VNSISSLKDAGIIFQGIQKILYETLWSFRLKSLNCGSTNLCGDATNCALEHTVQYLEQYQNEMKEVRDSLKESNPQLKKEE
jgi:hypothetical protein